MNKKEQIDDLNQIIKYAKSKYDITGEPGYQYLEIWRKCLSDLRSIDPNEEKVELSNLDIVNNFLNDNYVRAANHSVPLKTFYDHLNKKDMDIDELKLILNSMYIELIGTERHEYLKDIKKI